MALEKELEKYERERSGWLAQGFAGRYAVIHGEEVVGIFDGLGDALRAGYDRFLNEPFLVREIREHDKTHSTSRSLRPCPSSTDP
jgi:hypothetical protein